MNLVPVELKENLNQYFDGDLCKRDLGKWAGKKYYEILQGKYFIIEYLYIYNFVKVISTFHKEPDDIRDEYPANEAQIFDIKQIMNGEKNTVLYGNLKIHRIISSRPEYRHQMHRIKEIHSIICEKEICDDLSCNQLDALLYYLKQIDGEIITMIDLLESYFMSMIAGQLILKDDAFAKRCSFNLYVGKDDNPNQYIKIHQLFACIMGETPFATCINYVKGIPSISVLI